MLGLASSFVPRLHARDLQRATALCLCALLSPACATDNPDDGQDTGVVDDTLPATSWCDPVREWPADLAAFEQALLDATNAARATAQDCKTQGLFAATAPLASNAALLCAARVQSLDLATQGGSLSHTGSDGSTVGDRATSAGYGWSFVGENIALGPKDAQSVVALWLTSDGHCANIMSPDYTEFGGAMARSATGTAYWTQVFGDR